MIPLFSAQQVRDADGYAINSLGIPSIVLMENAARSIYEVLIQNMKELRNNIAGIICGKGNNGGDGFALARQLVINDFHVHVITLGSEEELKGDALTNFRILKNLLQDYPESKLILYNSYKDLVPLDECSLIVDAMLGTGSRGELTDPYKTIVEHLNELNAFKVSIDLPTGLDLENSFGQTIYNADLTITLSEYKTGLFYGHGYAHSGTIVKGSIGIGEEYYQKLTTEDYLIEPEDAFQGLPIKPLDAHKYSAGRVLVIAGSGNYPGAACFVSNSVLGSGAGSCFLAFPKSIKSVVQQKLTSTVVLPYEDEGREYLSEANFKEIDEKINWADVIAVGSGLGKEESTQKFVVDLLKNHKQKKIVIDADALYALRNEEYKKLNLKNKILTPHHKEFADLLGIDIEELEKNLTKYGKEFAKENSCFLVLKGAPTIIFNPNGEMFINSSGNPGMAKFGTGDVLTGIIAGFLAQSIEIEEPLISAVYLHSLTADLLLENKTEYGYTCQDIMEEFPNAIKFILDSFV
jgi:ADP-dependent NAD(P)H-hydrate dehydratase / NAD(P)H-hydrate epimerase